MVVELLDTKVRQGFGGLCGRGPSGSDLTNPLSALHVQA
jgi:hypothetical protein